jgi:hypothetical protein
MDSGYEDEFASVRLQSAKENIWDYNLRGRNAVGIAAGCGLDDRGVGLRVPVGSRIFFTLSRPVLGSSELSAGTKLPLPKRDCLVGQSRILIMQEPLHRMRHHYMP